MMALSVCILVVMAGCGNSATSNSDFGKMKEVGQLEITPISMTSENTKDETKIKIKMSVENKGKKAIGVAAPDFVINNGDDHFYISEGINFSETIKPGKKITGNAYYTIPKDIKDFKLKYIPLDSDKRANWDLKVGNNK